jgi:lytic cellulose monooxygenase (C1-hydroxylating)
MHSVLVLAALAATVSAHATFQDLWVDGVDKVSTCVRLPPNNNPVTDVSSTDIRCNVGGTTGVSGVCTVEGKGPALRIPHGGMILT